MRMKIKILLNLRLVGVEPIRLLLQIGKGSHQTRLFLWVMLLVVLTFMLETVWQMALKLQSKPIVVPMSLLDKKETLKQKQKHQHLLQTKKWLSHSKMWLYQIPLIWKMRLYQIPLIKIQSPVIELHFILNVITVDLFFMKIH